MASQKSSKSKDLILVVHSKEVWALEIAQALNDAGFQSKMYLHQDSAKEFMANKGGKINLIMSDNLPWLRLQQKTGKQALYLPLNQKRAKGLQVFGLDTWGEREFIILVHKMMGVPFFPTEPFAVVVPKVLYLSTEVNQPTKFIVAAGDAGLVMYVGFLGNLHADIASNNGIPYKRVLGGASLYLGNNGVLMITGESREYGGLPQFILQQFCSNILVKFRKLRNRIERVQVSVEPCGNEDEKFWNPYR